ncbi:MAG: SDR family NAD(P)-dependent oxidoreductase [Oscillospiraceae bacterium]|jgi:NAD(P)-dependent dehydrogenase (short-subunit alcohol dehydrogenase family)|nr:SDR family NAD(P)-dependent oxidoreductase [Oscillospiraceae bacterium]
MFKVQGKTAFITGAASGIGLGIAKACAKHGMKVVVTDVRRKAVDEALVWFKDNGYEAYGIALDVTDREGYAAAADEAEKIFGGIHLLVNNAGVEAPMGKVWENSYNDFDFMVNVNIRGVLNGVKTILPRILAHGEGGQVVTTCSQSGMYVVPGAALYCMCKAGLIGLMETLQADLRGTNVGASAFCPGPIKGNLSETSREVRPAELTDAASAPAAPAAPPPPPPPAAGDDTRGNFTMPDFSSFILPAEAAGEYVVRGAERQDLYIFTHTDFKASMVEKGDAIVRAYPDQPLKAGFAQAFSFLTQNPVYPEVTTPVGGFE